MPGDSQEPGVVRTPTKYATTAPRFSMMSPKESAIVARAELVAEFAIHSWPFHVAGNASNPPPGEFATCLIEAFIVHAHQSPIPTPLLGTWAAPEFIPPRAPAAIPLKAAQRPPCSKSSSLNLSIAAIREALPSESGITSFHGRLPSEV